MDFKNFLDELNTLHDERGEIIERIKSHGLPVILYGAGFFAKSLTEKLEANGCEVAGYAVDDEYFTPNQTCLQRPVYRFSSLLESSDRYIFIYAINKMTEENLNASIRNFIYCPSICTGYDTDYPTIDREYVLKNREKFSETFNLLEDDLSRKTFIHFLKLKITGNFSWNFDVCRPNEYFNDLTATALHDAVGGGCYLDCGAYRGDTIEAFVKWSGGHYKKIIGFEPDPGTFAVLENFVRERGYKNVTLLNCGVYDRKAVLAFNNQGNMSSTFSANGTASIAVEKIDDVVGSEHVSLIKMDVEGCELHALQGAISTIKRDKPVLAISAEHRSEDLITLPQYIKSLYGGYKFYLRKSSLTSEWDIDIYAIP